MNEKIQDFFLNCDECVLENPRNFYGCFTLGPFKNSQSLTVANALRRTLLSELRGVAITHLEIDGTIHEYSTITGVRESILDILLNFKHIVLKKTSPLKKPLLGYLNVRGPGIVRAADLKLPSIIQCVDPDQYIATLAENGKLILKFTISDFQNFTQMKEISESFQMNNEQEMSKNQIKNLSLNTLKNKIENVYSKQTNSFFKKKNKIKNKFQKTSTLFHTLNNLQSKLQSNPVVSKSSNKLTKRLSIWQAHKQAANKQQSTFVSTFVEALCSRKSFSFLLFYDHENLLAKKSITLLKQKTNNRESSQTNRIKSTKLRTPAKKNSQQFPTNSLWIDPIFNPILKVNYLIETIQPLKTDIPNQRIRVELWTNGSIHPRKAFYDALTYLKTMFDKLDSMKFLNYKFTNTFLESEKTMNKILKIIEYDFSFYNSLEEQKNVLFSADKKFIPKEIQQIEKDYSVELFNNAYKNILEVSIEKLSLPSRLKKALTKNNLFVIGDILKYSPSELKTLPGIGNVSISVIQKHFTKIGLKLESKKK